MLCDAEEYTQDCRFQPDFSPQWQDKETYSLEKAVGWRAFGDDLANCCLSKSIFSSFLVGATVTYQGACYRRDTMFASESHPDVSGF